MTTYRLLYFIPVLLFLVSPVQAKRAFTVKHDLSDVWLIYEDDQYKPFSNGEDTNTIYFTIDANKYGGDYIHINSYRKFSIFINGKLASGGGIRFNIDSLAKIFGSTLLNLAIHQKNISQETLQVTIETPVTQAQTDYELYGKPPTYLRDFVIVASMIILSLLIVIIRLNPKLASDYFSITRIFSLREADDSQIYTRIGNSTNILFYIFSSLILGFYLIVVFHFISPAYSITSLIHPESFLSAFVQWLGLSLIILTVFFLKIVLVYITANLFGSRELAGIHFFNWVRLILIVFSTMSVILYFYFILRGQSSWFHALLLNLIAWSLAGWIVIIFLKLRGRSSYSIFHLFSYICATEIIPLMIIMTVLYN